MRYKTGRNPSPKPPKLWFWDYLLEAKLPPVPTTFGHQNLYAPRGWGMLANDRVGNCAIAGPDHCVMVFNKIAGRRVHFTAADAIDDYSAITGYNPDDPSTDTGADMVQVADYWRKTGLRDNRNNRHKIVAYLHVDPTNLAHVDAACYLFEAVGLGIQVGSAEENEFMHARPWVTPGSDSNGGHYVPMIGKDADYRKVVTWGGLQDVGEDWLGTQLTEVVAMVSEEALISGKSAEGFDMAALQADLQALKA
jgi:hypothetical protein